MSTNVEPRSSVEAGSELRAAHGRSSPAPGSALDFETRLGNILIGLAREICKLHEEEQELRAIKERWAQAKANAHKHTRGRLTWLLERQSRAAQHFFETVDPKEIAEYEIEKNDEGRPNAGDQTRS